MRNDRRGTTAMPKLGLIEARQLQHQPLIGPTPHGGMRGGTCGTECVAWKTVFISGALRSLLDDKILEYKRYLHVPFIISYIRLCCHHVIIF